MTAISHETMQQLLNDANAELRAAFPELTGFCGIEIAHSACLDGERACGFNPTITIPGSCSNSAARTLEFAKAFELAAKLVEAIPYKGAGITY